MKGHGSEQREENTAIWVKQVSMTGVWERKGEKQWKESGIWQNEEMMHKNQLNPANQA